MKDRTQESMFQAIKQLYKTLGNSLETFTTDRGKEFACYAKVESELNIPVYFADSHAPWQRESNENSNGLLRNFFPKKRNFSKVTNDELLDALLLLNHRPRKCLGFKSPFEMLLHEISKLE